MTDLDSGTILCGFKFMERSQSHTTRTNYPTIDNEKNTGNEGLEAYR